MDNSLICNAITVYMPSAASQYIHREFKMAVNWGDLEISADASSGGEGNQSTVDMPLVQQHRHQKFVLIQFDWF